MASFSRKISLYRRFVIDEGDDDFAVFCRVLMANDELVAFEDAGIFHAVPLDDEHEAVVIADEISREGYRRLRRILRQRWGPRRGLGRRGGGGRFSWNARNLRRGVRWSGSWPGRGGYSPNLPDDGGSRGPSTSSSVRLLYRFPVPTGIPKLVDTGADVF